MAFIALLFAGGLLFVLGIFIFASLLFLILAIVFRKKKPVRIVFTVLTVLTFLPVAGAVWLIFYS